MQTEEFIVVHMDWTLIAIQIINLLVIILLLASPFIIWKWLSKREKERKEQMNRIEEKLDQMEKKTNLT